MEDIPLPSTKEARPLDGQPNAARIIISPCYPGYGTTLGNSLRRVLFSSLPGAAVTAIKIKGVEHEFSTIPHVKEDIVEIILNIKLLRFRLHSEDPIELELSVKGERVVTAADFEKNSQVEIINPKSVIATLTDPAAEFHLKVIVQHGRGYVPVEAREKEKLDIGYIAIDAIYTSIRNVNFHTEHVRVGQMTNFDKLLLDITTDGTISPEEAFRLAAKILVNQFQCLAEEEKELPQKEEASEEGSEPKASAESPSAESVAS